jgi:HEAT repeat protein
MFDPVEMAASKALRQIGRPAALALVEEVKHGPSRMSIGSTLEDLAHLVVPELAELSKSTDERIRERAVEVLGKAGKDAAPVLGEALRDVEESVRKVAGSSLMEMGPDAPGALRELIAAVERRDPDIIAEVVAALGKIGLAAKDALPALRSLNREEHVPEGMKLSAGLRGEIEKSVKKIEGQVRNP